MNEKERRLSQEIARLHRKKEKLEFLLKARESLDLADKWRVLDDELKSVLRKRSRLKEHLAWCIARDIVNHAIKEGAQKIHCEDLRFVNENHGGRWNYSSIQKRIEEVAQLESIDFVIVPAKNSSQTDPFSDTILTHATDRQVVLDDGSRIDRDYSAALELGRRQKATKNNKTKPKNIIKKTSCRDKHKATPKRPKNTTRRATRISQSRNKKRIEGLSVVVAVSSEARVSTHPLPFVGLNAIEHYSLITITLIATILFEASRKDKNI